MAGVYTPPTNSHYAHVLIPQYVNIGKFIGKGGYNLKLITSVSKCSYVWFNKSMSVVEVWGSEKVIPHAVKLVKEHINTFKPPLEIAVTYCEHCNQLMPSDEIKYVTNINEYSSQ